MAKNVPPGVALVEAAAGDVVADELMFTRAANAAGLAAITTSPGFKADVAHTHTWETAQAAAFQAAKPFADELAKLCGAHHAPDSDTAKLIGELQQTLGRVELREYARHGFVIDDSPAPKPDPVLAAGIDHLAAMAYGAKPWGSPAPAMPTVAAPPAIPAGDVQPHGPALTENQSQVLKTLALFDGSQLLSAATITAEMDRSARLNVETVRQCVGKLIESGWAERPEGERSGARLTNEGRRVVGKIAD